MRHYQCSLMVPFNMLSFNLINFLTVKVISVNRQRQARSLLFHWQIKIITTRTTGK